MEPKIEYADMVAQLSKSGQAILVTLTPARVNILHMAVGISGEAGELLDAVKKVVIYDKTADRSNIVEELGDLEFYMEGLRQAFDITRDETLQANIAKLGQRYHNLQYTDAAAQERADKQLTGEVLDCRLSLMENAIYQLCATLSAQPAAVDNIGTELAKGMEALRKEVVAEHEAKKIILPPH